MARLDGRGARLGPARRLDTVPPVELAAKLDNAWAPDVAARGRRVAVAWIDFHTYDWRPYLRASPDGGATWGAQRPLSDAPLPAPDNAEESLDDAPDIALGAGPPRVAFVDFRKRASGTRPHPLYDIYLNEPGGASRQVDPWGARQLNTFAPPLRSCAAGCWWPGRTRAAASATSACAEWARTARARAIARVDDKGAAGSNAWRPDLAPVTGGRVLAAWEDERDGPSQIFYAAARSRAIR